MDVVDIKLKAYRLVAYSAVVFSVASVFSICVTLPMIYHFAESSKIRLNKEANYCRVSDLYYLVYEQLSSGNSEVEAYGHSAQQK
ncbi:hypothetical protein ANCDUO_14956 [Ancylostoma duodenale]|uniref:Nematode cuticle collagen N-terminal domain-containing protein n=1 Tax=Ancylostoma duodenale TaxID=51022 RepID=A0A0C2G7N0_9BILA|nr:hypothetical protein ANCDUO_14956 [Ancylostoma duodenale]